MAHPTVFWLSCRDRIDVRVTLSPSLQATSPPSDIVCTFDTRSLSLSAKGAENAPYSFNVELFAEVDASRCSYRITGSQWIEITLIKRVASPWPRLVSSSVKNPKIKVDWENWDENTHDDGVDVASPPASDSNGAGGAAAAAAANNIKDGKSFEETEAEIHKQYEAIKAKDSQLTTHAYLTVFNAVLVFGWIYVVLQLIAIVAAGGTWQDMVNRVYPRLGHVVLILQAIGTVEVINSLLKLSAGNWLAGFLMHAGRNILLFGIVWQLRDVQRDTALFVLYLAFGIGDAIRYAVHLINSLGFYNPIVMPSWLNWLRHSSFLILMPLGFAMEMRLLWVSLPYITNWRIAGLPTTTIIMIYAAVAYGIGAPYLFMAMLKQRRAKLFGKKKAKSS